MKHFLKSLITIMVFFSLLAGTDLSAIDPHQCGANLINIPNQTAPYNEHWSYIVPIQTYMGCDFDYELQLIQGPAGMTLNHLTLNWDPSYSQLGQSFPVTVRLTVTYFEPYRVEVKSDTFYVTVIECQSLDVKAECEWETVGTFDLRAKVYVKNYSNCYVKTSGYWEVDDWGDSGNWNNVTVSPNERLLVWAKTYYGFNDGVVDTLNAEITSIYPDKDTNNSNDNCTSLSPE